MSTKDNKQLQWVQRMIVEAGKRDSSFPTNQLSDGFHTFAELYEFRKAYNALLFNQWSELGMYDVHKSMLHNDGEEIFPDSPHTWFIVCATLPTGQISNHYKVADWDLFKVRAVKKAKYPWDGHTSQDVLQRILNLLK